MIFIVLTSDNDSALVSYMTPNTTDVMAISTIYYCQQLALSVPILDN
jgi:hypothetical protein